MAKHRRGPWSQTEDQYLLQLVQSQGAHNWVRISQLITSRSPKQCRERFHQNLKPSLNLSPITPEEGALIERMVAEMGKRWAEIARRLNGRSDNAVKNWWNGGMNRRKRLDNRRSADAAISRQTLNTRPTNYDPPMHTVTQAPTFQSPFPMDAQQSHPRLQPLPPPIITSAPKIHSQRRFMEDPVPSPSAVSNISRNDSVDGPPSLISEMSGYSTQSQSPHTPYGINGTALELPPLPAGSVERNTSLAASSGQVYQQSYNHSWVFPHAQEGIEPKVGPQSFHTSYYGYASQEHMKERAPMLPSQVRSYEQMALPSFRTVTAPDSREQGQLPSPPRDSRMSLRNVVD